MSQGSHGVELSPPTAWEEKQEASPPSRPTGKSFDLTLLTPGGLISGSKSQTPHPPGAKDQDTSQDPVE